MDKPRIFLGSSGKQEKLLKTLERGLDAVANVVPWTTSFNPGTTTLERLVELAHDVDFAAFAFARDDWTMVNTSAPAEGSGQASPRDNVVFEAGLFGGVLGMRRTFILHASGSKLPTDLLGLTSIRYGDETAAEMRTVNQKLRKAIETEGRLANVEGFWWQFSLTELSQREPSALSLLRITRDRDGALELRGHSWQADGRLSARYWSEAVKERKAPSGLFYYWRGERPLDANAPQLDGTGEFRLEFDRPRRRLFHDECRRSARRIGANVRHLRACQFSGCQNSRCHRWRRARQADRRSPEALEDDDQLSPVSGPARPAYPLRASGYLSSA